MAYMPGYMQRVGKQKPPWMMTPMQTKDMPMKPLSATEALDRATSTTKPAALSTPTVAGMALSGVNAITGFVGEQQRINALRDLRGEYKDEARRGDPYAQAAYSRGNREISAREKLGRTAATAGLSRTGGVGRGLLETRLTAGSNRARADLMGQTLAQDAAYRQQYRTAADAVGQDIAQSKYRPITAAVGALAPIPGLLQQDQQQKAASAQQGIENAQRQEALGLQRLGLEQVQSQFDARQKAEAERYGLEQRYRAQESELRARSTDRENLLRATEKGESRLFDQREGEADRTAQMARIEREYALRGGLEEDRQAHEIELATLKANLEGQDKGDATFTLGAFPKMTEFQTWLDETYEGLSVQGALEQAYKDNNYEDISMLYGNLKKHYELDVPQTNNLTMKAVAVLQDPSSPEEVKQQAMQDLKDVDARLNSRFSMLSPAARDAYYSVTGAGPRESALGVSMRAQGEAAQKNPFGYALYETKFR